MHIKQVGVTQCDLFRALPVTWSGRISGLSREWEGGETSRGVRSLGTHQDAGYTPCTRAQQSGEWSWEGLPEILDLSPAQPWCLPKTKGTAIQVSLAWHHIPVNKYCEYCLWPRGGGEGFPHRGTGTGFLVRAYTKTTREGRNGNTRGG